MNIYEEVSRKVADFTLEDARSVMFGKLYGRRPPAVTPASTLPINDILKMDGRKTAPRVRVFPPILNHSPKVSAVKRSIKMFLDTGESGGHSSNAILLRYIVAYCEQNTVGYVLERWVIDGRAMGYGIKRVDCQSSPFLERA